MTRSNYRVCAVARPFALVTGDKWSGPSVNRYGSGMNGFVLSGGANVGSIHAGMLEALFGAGIYPDVLVGTSIGAANAAFIAADPTLRGARKLSDTWRGVRCSDVLPFHPLRAARGILRAGSLFSRDAFMNFIGRNLPYSRIEDSRIPLRIVATAFEDGAKVIFNSGNVLDAVMASTALPGIFAPYEIGGRRYLDGGLVDNVPIEPAVAAGADTIYVLSADCPASAPSNMSIKSVLMHSVGLLMARKTEMNRDMLAERLPHVRFVFLPHVPHRVGLRDFTHTEQLISEAHRRSALFLAGRPYETPQEASALRLTDAPALSLSTALALVRPPSAAAIA